MLSPFSAISFGLMPHDLIVGMSLTRQPLMNSMISTFLVDNSLYVFGI